MTCHPKLKSVNKFIFKYLDLPNMDKEVKRLFTPKLMISFWSARKLSSYLVRAKLYPTEKTVGSFKCGGKGCEFYINLNETSTFTSTVTGETYIKNQDVWSTFWLAISVKFSMLGRVLTCFGQDRTITKVTWESMIRDLHTGNNICLTIFVPLAIAFSYRMSH